MYRWCGHCLSFKTFIIHFNDIADRRLHGQCAPCTRTHIVLRFVNTKIYNYKRGTHNTHYSSTANVVCSQNHRLPVLFLCTDAAVLFAWNLNISIANHHLNEYNRFKSRRWKKMIKKAKRTQRRRQQRQLHRPNKSNWMCTMPAMNEQQTN